MKMGAKKHFNINKQHFQLIIFCSFQISMSGTRGSQNIQLVFLFHENLSLGLNSASITH